MFGRHARLASVASGSRSPELSQIRRALALPLIAAPLRWQESQQVVVGRRYISVNKAHPPLPLRLMQSLASGDSDSDGACCCVLPRWTKQRRAGSEGDFFNKLVMFLKICCVEEMVAADWRFFLSHRGDGVGDRRCKAPLRSARQGAAVLLGVHQPRPSFAEVINGFWGHSALWCLMHCSFCNLQAGVPSGRPFCVSVTALLVSPSPSGFVPGDVADGRDVERFFIRGGEGLNCIPFLSAKVLSVNAKGLVVFFFLFVVLDVTCTPTD